MEEKEQVEDNPVEGSEAERPATKVGKEAKSSASAPVSKAKGDEEDLEEQDEDDEEEEDEEGEGDGDPDAALHQFEHDDPLGPGYDLDGGELIDQQDANLPWQTDVSSPKEFFSTELLYRFDVVEPENRKLFDGTYRIELKGDQNLTWSITVGEDLKISTDRKDAEIVLKMSEGDFMELVNGRLNPQLAILAQKMKIEGEVRKAILFHELLIPAPEQ